MSHRGGGRSGGTGGSSGNAPPPPSTPSDVDKQNTPAAVASTDGAPSGQPTSADASSSGNAPSPTATSTVTDDAKGDAPALPDANPARTARLKLAGYMRPSVEEFVKAGYDAENYETYFDKHEAGLEAELDKRASAAKPVPPHSGWIRCRAVKTCLVRGMVKGPGDEFWLSEEEALRAIDKGSAEPV